MEITGEVIEILPIEEVGQKNTKKGGFAIKYMSGDYEKKLAFTVWEKNLPKIEGVSVGDDVTVKINLESNEHNGRWFTNAIAWDVETLEGKKEETVSEDSNDLPF